MKNNTDEFVKYVGLLKEWFKLEEIELPDTVLGRIASRIQDIINEDRLSIAGKIQGMETKIDNVHYEQGFDDALDEVLKLLEE